MTERQAALGLVLLLLVVLFAGCGAKTVSLEEHANWLFPASWKDSDRLCVPSQLGGHHCRSVREVRQFLASLNAAP